MEDTINLENTCKLEAAIQQINNVKRNLGKNSSEVKSQIRTSISRLLEALRNREVWLLNQVDLIVSAKEEVLHHQQAGLNKQLGILQSSQSTERFELGDLKPGETPFIDFRADPASLRERIVNFGRVDVTGVPPKSVFVSPGNPSSSLPRHFEEYEDADHHVLYKTLEDVSRKKTSDTCVYVSFPRLSTRAEDWLAQTKLSTTTESQPKFSFPPFSNNTSDWLLHTETMDSAIVTSTTCFTDSVVSAKAIPSVRSAPSIHENTTNASIHSWLQQIKQNPDVEKDDDFELVENSDSIGSLEDLMTVTNSERSMPSSKSAPQLDVWINRQVSDDTPWLNPDVKKRDHPACQTDLFKHFTQVKLGDTQKWLAPHQTTNVENNASCNGDKCRTTTFPMEIENLGDHKCLIDKNKWLKQPCIKQEVPEISWLCKANEPCKKSEECLSDPSCMEKYLQNSSGTTCNFMKVFDNRKFQHSTSEDSKWIVNGGKNVQPTTVLQNTMLNFQLNEHDLSDWLKTDQPSCNKNSPNITNSSFVQVHQGTDVSDWIKKDQNQRVPEPTTRAEFSPLFSKLACIHGDSAGLTKWLLSSDDSTTVSEDSVIHCEDKDNSSDREKWLFRSDKAAGHTGRGDGEIWFQANDLEVGELA